MPAPRLIQRCTPEEYLRRERQAHFRSEFLRGEIFAMAGGTAEQSLITSSVIAALHAGLKGGPCRVYDSNLRICVSSTGLYTYPDASVICGNLEFDPLDTRQETVINPTTLVEVLSPSTEAYDRGAKFEHYRNIKTLREYVLVSQGTRRVESFLLREDGTWLYTPVGGHDRCIFLKSSNVELSLGEIYSGATIVADEPGPAIDEVPAAAAPLSP